MAHLPEGIRQNNLKVVKKTNQSLIGGLDRATFIRKGSRSRIVIHPDEGKTARPAKTASGWRTCFEGQKVVT
jgi:hypothetical protein